MGSNQKKIKVLTFGHLPISVGGKQHSGAAIGIWNIANTINLFSDNINYFIAATDIHNIEKQIDKTPVFGWNKQLLFKEIFRHFFSSLLLFFQAVQLYFNFRLHLFKTYGKLIFFYRSIKVVNPDVIHFHEVASLIICSKLVNIRHIKKLITFHGIAGDDEKIDRHKYARKMEVIASNLKFTQKIFISKHVQKQWKELYGKTIANSTAIYPGINLVAFNYSPISDSKSNLTIGKKIILCTVGSLSDRKGQMRVIQAIGALSTKDNFHYICIGAGKKSVIDGLIRDAKKLNVSLETIGNISQEELKKYLSFCDYMILPSSSEGFGAVYLESIACGTPVIIPKILPLANEPNILNETNSVFINDHSVEAIKECLSNLVDFPYSRTDVSNSVDFKVFTWEYGCSKYIDIINSIQLQN